MELLGKYTNVPKQDDSLNPYGQNVTLSACLGTPGCYKRAYFVTRRHTDSGERHAVNERRRTKYVIIN